MSRRNQNVMTCTGIKKNKFVKANSSNLYSGMVESILVCEHLFVNILVRVPSGKVIHINSIGFFD